MTAKTQRNYWLAVAQSLVAAALGVSSLLLWVVFPRGYFPAQQMWVSIHTWSGLALGVLVLAHFALHYRWMVRMTRRQLPFLRSAGPDSSEQMHDLGQHREAGVDEARDHIALGRVRVTAAVGKEPGKDYNPQRERTGPTW